MYFHKPQEKPRKWGSFQDVQFAVMKNCEKIYGVDPDSIVLAMPLFWGLPALDYSGNNNHGTNHGATYKDGSLGFDGNDYVSAVSIVADVPLTISAWFRANSISGVQTLASVHYNNEETFRLFLYNDDVGAQSLTNVHNAFARTASTIKIGKLHSATAVFNSSILRKAYLDANDEATNTTSIVLSGLTDLIDIGRNGGNGSAYEYFDGFIDEIRISKTARTADQIALFHDLPWGLYQPVSRPVYFFQAAVGGVAPTGNLYGPLFGPFAGPI